MSKFIPDFSAIGKTNWSKPNLDTRNPFWWVMVGAALLMVVFVFIPWQTLVPAITATSYGGPIVSYGVIQTSKTIGITTWYGLLGLFFALVVVYGAFYNQKQYVFCGALLAAVMGLIGNMCTADAYIDGKYFPAEEIISEVNEKNSELSVSHTGAIWFLVASLVAAVTAFLQIKEENKTNDESQEKHDERLEKHDEGQENHDEGQENHDESLEKHDEGQENHDESQEKHDEGQENHDESQEKHDEGQEKHDEGQEKHDER